MVNKTEQAHYTEEDHIIPETLASPHAPSGNRDYLVQHGGHMRAESMDGKGCIITLLPPINSGQTDSTSQADTNRQTQIDRQVSIS